MTNPNPAYNRADADIGRDPFDDPNFDLWRWIATINFRMDPESLRELAIARWLKAAGFTEVHVSSLPERGPDCWQAIMGRGSNERCPTGLAAQALMNELAADLGCRIEQGESSGLAWGDQIGVAFRLRQMD